MIAPHEITLLLQQIDEGRDGALDELMRVVYSDLERMAASHLRHQFGERADQITLEPSALVNESFLRIIKQRKQFDNRGQFFAIATRIMLRVSIDYRREKMAAKRGGSNVRMTLSLDKDLPDSLGDATSVIDIEALTTALDELEKIDQRKADIVKMRVVWGMTVPDVAEALQISPSSVDRDWKFAKAWIAAEVGLTEQ